MADRRPGLILRGTSTQDVVAAVGVAREHGLAPAVRGGGHNVAGKGMSDGGLTIDLSGTTLRTSSASTPTSRPPGNPPGRAPRHPR
jgi:FAD/FMN-containing dehydrogenase